MWFYSETVEILHIQLNFNFKRPKFLILIFTYFYCVKFLAYKFGRVKSLTNRMSDDDAAYDDGIVETNLNWSVIRRCGGCLGGILPRVGRRGVRCKMVQSLRRLMMMVMRTMMGWAARWCSPWGTELSLFFSFSDFRLMVMLVIMMACAARWCSP